MKFTRWLAVGVTASTIGVFGALNASAQEACTDDEQFELDDCIFEATASCEEAVPNCTPSDDGSFEDDLLASFENGITAKCLKLSTTAACKSCLRIAARELKRFADADGDELIADLIQPLVEQCPARGNGKGGKGGNDDGPGNRRPRPEPAPDEPTGGDVPDDDGGTDQGPGDDDSGPDDVGDDTDRPTRPGPRGGGPIIPFPR